LIFFFAWRDSKPHFQPYYYAKGCRRVQEK
jgi:hypothetical protein